MKDWENSTIEQLLQGGIACECGKVHKTAVKYIDIGRGAIRMLPQRVKELGGSHVQMYADANTWQAAGRQAYALLQEAGIACSVYQFPQKRVYADAAPVGQAAMHLDHSADMILAVGGGTINDICKILSGITGRPYIILGTAPSMDGFASDTSSMVVDGVKASLPSANAAAIIGDTEILAAAPMDMIAAGLGDMLAKYVSICEWRISHIINDEYFCPHVAQLVRNSLAKCAADIEGLRSRDPDAMAGVMEGLVLSGMAMAFAGVTRPASGMEHYFSHLWDMRALEFGTEERFHGAQVGVGTVQALRVYEKLQTVTPDRAKALAAAAAFDISEWEAEMRDFLGGSAEGILEIERREGKFDKARHALRLEVILAHWEEILQAIREELPPAEQVIAMLEAVGGPTQPAQLDVDMATAKRTFVATKDIRDKYIGSRLLWDLGLLDDFAAELFAE